MRSEDEIWEKIKEQHKEKIKMAEMTLKDSGARREFGTGAVRDASEGKGRCDLIPLDIAASLVKSDELSLIEEFKREKDTYHLTRAIYAFSNRTGGDLTNHIIRG